MKEICKGILEGEKILSFKRSRMNLRRFFGKSPVNLWDLILSLINQEKNKN